MSVLFSLILYILSGHRSPPDGKIFDDHRHHLHLGKVVDNNSNKKKNGHQITSVEIEILTISSLWNFLYQVFSLQLCLPWPLASREIWVLSFDQVQMENLSTVSLTVRIRKLDWDRSSTSSKPTTNSFLLLSAHLLLFTVSKDDQVKKSLERKFWRFHQTAKLPGAKL